MQLIMDMVHDNPGEKRFQTIFRDPKMLAKLGYNTQVFKHANTVATFEAMGENFFDSEEAKNWLEHMTKIVTKELSDAKSAGLLTMSHIDLFVLPKAMVEKYRSEICDEDGKISIFREKTKEIHRCMFDELFQKYPIDGLIIRVGETYLYDTPFHTGNGAVKYGDKTEEQNMFVELINFLVDEVCKKHGKYLIFRTWDCFADKFHADLQYYLEVTDRIPKHEKLIFSIKHTALDFWRNVKFNPCIGAGKHPQVIEIQCQREYEGKGAYPMYVMDGVINGFPENRQKRGLKDLIDNPLIRGIYTWSRGGGWHGPYIQNEFWCKLNTYVISNYANDPSRTEKEIFQEFIREELHTDQANAEKFYELCQVVSEAILHGRYISDYDRSLEESFMPSNNWLRDDRIGEPEKLDPVFTYLEKNGLLDQALEEKRETVVLWEKIKKMFSSIKMENEQDRRFIEQSIEYGLRLFNVIEIYFQILAKNRKNEKIDDLLKQYETAWERYQELEKESGASSCYHETYDLKKMIMKR